jgi:hypothetical protein
MVKLKILKSKKEICLLAKAHKNGKMRRQLTSMVATRLLHYNLDLNNSVWPMLCKKLFIPAINILLKLLEMTV